MLRRYGRAPSADSGAEFGGFADIVFCAIRTTASLSGNELVRNREVIDEPALARRPRLDARIGSWLSAGQPASSPLAGESGGVPLARPGRFELPTPGSVDQCSIQLSYGRICRAGARTIPGPVPVSTAGTVGAARAPRVRECRARPTDPPDAGCGNRSRATLTHDEIVDVCAALRPAELLPQILHGRTRTMTPAPVRRPNKRKAARAKTTESPCMRPNRPIARVLARTLLRGRVGRRRGLRRNTTRAWAP
jgi:hypothetical protein